MLKYVYLYLIALGIFLIIDLIWLNLIAKNLYQKEIGSLLLKNPNLIPALIFYLLFIVALLILVLIPGINSYTLTKTLLLGAVFGFITYATYDLTNLATLDGWSIKMTIIDLIWGTSVTTLITFLGYIIGSKIL
ncbi:MAG TPA: DUF2177 family protein [Candidatus Dojkabacteria bacterium]|nr:DUF2177 family protein [Candidatus Dojkabacteria bacterium]